MTQAKSSPPSSTRRRLFAGAGTAGALAAAAVALPLAREAGQQADAALPKAAPEPGGGYQVTQHVLRYYQTAKV